MMFLKLFFCFCSLLLILPASKICIAKSLSLEAKYDEVEKANRETCGDPKFNDTWIVKIESDSHPLCEGVLVSDRHILTASGCGQSGNKSRLIFANDFVPNVDIEHRADFNSLISVLTLNSALAFSSPDVGVRPACLPRKSTIGQEQKCSHQPANNSELYFCRKSACEAETTNSRTILVEDNGIIYVTGISLGNCDAKFEIPYINIFELIGWIEMQINPGKRKPKQLDFCNTENPGVIEETCPIIIESYSGVPTCEGRDRFVRGQVRLDNFNKCNIFCPVFPHNTITITLDEAQSLCWQQKEEMEQKKEMEKAKTAYLEETEFVNSKESVKVGAWDQLDSTAVVVEPSKNDFMQKYDCGKTNFVDANFISGAQNNGEINPVGNWPWMASLGFYDDSNRWNHQCGATLITDRHFLTSAHCVSTSFKLRIGDFDHASDRDDKNAIDFEIINSIKHPKFNEDESYYDVAILETKKVNISRSIRPICLPDSPSDDPDKHKNVQVELIGWGQNNLHGQISEKLKRVSLKVFPISVCNYTHTQSTISTKDVIEQKLPQLFQNHLLCAGVATGGNQGSCKGDSGGPLMYEDFVGETFKWIQIATVQGSVRDCGDVDFPGIYVRLDEPSVYDFIKSNTNIN